jgi:hypothetical protein
MFSIKVVEKIKTHILCLLTFFPKNRAGYNDEKFGGAREAVDDSIAARCVIDNEGYTQK